MTTESRHQQALIKWSEQPSVRRNYPELKLMYHIPNERHCTPAQGKQLKLMGVRSGVPDLHLPVARGKYHSLYIEMKDDTGCTSANQNWWIDELSAQGNFCAVCHGWVQATTVILWYLEGAE